MISGIHTSVSVLIKKSIDAGPSDETEAQMRTRAAPVFWMIRSNIVNRVVDVVGDAWVLRIVGRLLEKPCRFDELVAGLGMARSTLSNRLQHLVAHDIVMRDSTDAPLPARAYALTARGRDLLPLLRQMQAWNSRWGRDDEALKGVTVLNPCGHDAAVVMRCAHCHAPAEARSVKVMQICQHPPEVPLAPWRRVRVAEPSTNGNDLPAETLMGDRWMGLILAAAFFRAEKYSDIEQVLGIAPHLLAVRLRRLVQQGLLERSRYSPNAERHAYRLTECGRSYYSAIVAAWAWGRRWLDPNDAPGWRLLHLPCANWLEPAFVCAVCDTRLL